MITRLKISGFKNLVNVDLKFGPFTCIAGINAVGKSNLFDAIQFISLLATDEIMSAASIVRSEGQKASDVRDLFLKVGGSYSPRISFEVDLIIPKSAIDELGATATASITSVKYSLSLVLKYSEGVTFIEVERENLAPISLNDARRSLQFDCSSKWKKDVIIGRRSSTAPFISTETREDGRTFVRLHQDQERGKPFDRDPSKMGRTALSTVSAEFPTAYVVKEELKSWTLLQLEPSSLRRSDDFDKRRNAKIKADGSLMPATLFRLQNDFPERDVMQELANRLSELIEDVGEIKIDKDERRELLTLNLKTTEGVEYPARSLSDGTLRFLALTVIELDVKSGGIICLEEPENGIHPKKIPAMLKLLEDIACNPEFEANPDEGNPLRQVIINTHSPLVVQQVPEDSLLMAEVIEQWSEEFKTKFRRVVFRPLSDTWRLAGGKSDEIPISKGLMLSYLGNPEQVITEEQINYSFPVKKRIKRVVDRDDSKQLKLPLF